MSNGVGILLNLALGTDSKPGSPFVRSGKGNVWIQCGFFRNDIWMNGSFGGIVTSHKDRLQFSRPEVPLFWIPVFSHSYFKKGSLSI